MKGLAIKITSSGFNSPAQIMQKHLRQQNTSGFVYFSTDLAIDVDKSNEIDHVLFFNGRQQIFFLGDVEKILVNKKKKIRSTDENAFVPTDSALYSVPEYANERKRSWILIKNLRPVAQSQMNGWTTLNENIPVSSKIATPSRFTRFYFQ